MAIPKIVGAQRDFSHGQVDVSLKRSDEIPAMKTGCRQLQNWRLLNSGVAKNRPGRRALFSQQGRVERISMRPGQQFFIVFQPGALAVFNVSGNSVFHSTVLGDGVSPIPWTQASLGRIVYAVSSLVAQTSIYITYGDNIPFNVPQVLTWDGYSQTSTWVLSTFQPWITAEGAKQTFFDRISPQNITMHPFGQTGTISVAFSSAVLDPAMVPAAVRFSWCGRQLTIVGYTDSGHGTFLVNEALPPVQAVSTVEDPTNSFFNGDVVTGSISGAKGVVVGTHGGSPGGVSMQLLPSETTGAINHFSQGGGIYDADIISGPNGYAHLTPGGSTADSPPGAISVWSDEVMNSYRGWPASCFFDQSRLGFCNFPAEPAAIGWCAIGLPFDCDVEDFGQAPIADNAIYELVPTKAQVLYVVPGMESSEFAFCDSAIYWIPIGPTVPLTPGSVSFTLLSARGSYPGVQPRPIEQSILFVKQGGVEIGAVQTPGAYYRPNIVDLVSQFHSQLFTASPPIGLAAPPGSTQFEETYAYVILANGSLVVGRYVMHSGLIEAGADGKPKIGWSLWTGAGTVSWAAGDQGDLFLTTIYQVPPSANLVEQQDDTYYLDAAVLYNAPPSGLAAPPGKGPLWFWALGSVFVMDGMRPLGTYQVSATGYLVPQFEGGENLASPTLVCGQAWTATLEPFVPDAQPGPSAHQRMFKRRVSRMAAYVSQSTGFLMARLFSGPLSRTSPALGTVMNQYRVEAYNQDDDPTQPPPLREEAQRWRPLGRSFDPRVAIIKDTPGPLIVHEIGIEASI